jgi:hypothetical protein
VNEADVAALWFGALHSVVLCGCGEPARLRARSVEGVTLAECYGCFMNRGTRGTNWSLL